MDAMVMLKVVVSNSLIPSRSNSDVTSVYGPNDIWKLSVKNTFHTHVFHLLVPA